MIKLIKLLINFTIWAWSGGAMVLGKLPVPGRPTILMGKLQCQGVLLIWIIIGQGPTTLAVGACGGCLDIFSLVYHFSFLSPSLWETARYRLKYCLKGPLNPKQSTNQINLKSTVHLVHTVATIQGMVGWLFWGLTALSDNI